MEPTDAYKSISEAAGVWGLVLAVIAFGLVLVYTLRPGSRKTFDKAAKSILGEEKIDDDAQNQ